MIAMDLMVMKMILITIIHINKLLILDIQKEVILNLPIEEEMKEVQAMKKSIEKHQDLMVVLLMWTLQVLIIIPMDISKT